MSPCRGGALGCPFRPTAQLQHAGVGVGGDGERDFATTRKRTAGRALGGIEGACLDAGADLEELLVVRLEAHLRARESRRAAQECIAGGRLPSGRVDALQDQETPGSAYGRVGALADNGADGCV